MSRFAPSADNNQADFEVVVANRKVGMLVGLRKRGPAMRIEEFGVEIWMNAHENNCVFNLAETCVSSITLDELVQMSGRNDSLMSELLPMKMTYGAIEGSDRLRGNVCSLYRRQKPDNIMITHGTISANALVYEALINPGDHVVSIVPTYQQHVAIPQSYGAEVSQLRLREEDGFLPDLDALKTLMRPDTKLIVMTNPNNPTGALMGQQMLEEIAVLARKCGAYILCDEVYRGTDQTGDGFTASVADIYEKGISTAGLSKSFSLAGLRVGWIAAPPEVIEKVSIRRDYNTISVGMINDHFASMALEAKDKILSRSREITRGNLQMLDDWVQGEPHISYVRPAAATVALLKYDADMTSEALCLALLDQAGVLLVPGSVMDMEGYLRIGFANDPDALRAGLARVSGFLAGMTSHSN